MLRIEKAPYPGFEEVFPVISRAQRELGITMTLVGAGARNVWLELGGETRQVRITKDIDLAILTVDQEQYFQLITYLLEEEGFEKREKFPLSAFSPEGIQVDLLPFGPVSENDEVLFDGMESPAQVQGLPEACGQAVEVQYREEETFHVVTIGGLMMLKLIAFDDRPTQRGNDLDDLSLFLTSGYSLFLEAIQEQHWDILDRYEVDDDYGRLVGSHYLGRMIKEVVGNHEELASRLEEILMEHVEAGEEGALARRLIQQYGLSAETVKICLKALFDGFVER